MRDVVELKPYTHDNSSLLIPSQAGGYKCLVVDPPWHQGKTGKRSVRPNQNTILDYPTMMFDDIKNIPIDKWADDNAFLWLWATNSKEKKSRRPILRMAFDLVEHWGFKFYTMITWDKRTGPCPFGPYQIVTEHVLFCYRGKALFPKNSLGKMKTVFQAKSTAHSVKPDYLYRHIDEHFESPRLDVFARQEREGFDGWGNEYGK